MARVAEHSRASSRVHPYFKDVIPKSKAHPPERLTIRLIRKQSLCPPLSGTLTNTRASDLAHRMALTRRCCRDAREPNGSQGCRNRSPTTCLPRRIGRTCKCDPISVLQRQALASGLIKRRNAHTRTSTLTGWRCATSRLERRNARSNNGRSSRLEWGSSQQSLLNPAQPGVHLVHDLQEALLLGQERLVVHVADANQGR